MLWLGGDLECWIADFRFDQNVEFEFFSGLEFLRRVLMVPDEATAGGSSPRLRVDRACPGLMLPFYG